MNNYKNYAAFTGIVSSANFNSDTSLKRPILQLSVYNTEKEEWSTQVYVVFASNSLIRKSQKINEGDIISIFGSVSSYENKTCIRCRSFLILSKNIDKESEFFRRPAFFEFDVTPNVAILFGHVVHANEGSAYITIDNEEVVGGEIIKPATVSITYPIEQKMNAKDEIVFIGNFIGNSLEGTIKVIKEA